MNYFICALLVGLSLGVPPQTCKRARVEPTTDPILPSRAVVNVGITPGGRIIEEYNAEVVGRYYGPFLASAIPSLVRRDATREVDLVSELDGMNQTTIYGNFELMNVFVSSKQSVIYSMKQVSNLLIKYQANCLELSLQEDLSGKPYIHPTVVEFVFTRRAAEFDLAPKVSFLSPPSPLCGQKTGKCAFTMSEERYSQCLIHPNSSLRYMVLEVVEGFNLYHYQISRENQTVPFAQAMQIGERLIEMIQVLHRNASVVHGDIHSGNIMIESEDPLSLKFIDFARSFENTERPKMRIRETLWSTHQLFSAWEIDGFASSARDDVARIVETVAAMINPPEYLDFVDSLPVCDPVQILRWKKGEYIFAIPPRNGFESYDPVTELNLDTSIESQIRANLIHILVLVRSMRDTQAVPPYEELKNIFRNCHELVSDRTRA
jgi:hypothetical protein